MVSNNPAHTALVEKVARAIADNPATKSFDFDKAHSVYDFSVPATAAISVIREALQEPSDEMNAAGSKSNGWFTVGEEESALCWKAMLEASPIGGGK